MSVPGYFQKLIDELHLSTDTAHADDLTEKFRSDPGSYLKVDKPCSATFYEWAPEMNHFSSCPKCYYFASLKKLHDNTPIDRSSGRRVNAKINACLSSIGLPNMSAWQLPHDFTQSQTKQTFDKDVFDTMNTSIIPFSLETGAEEPQAKRPKRVYQPAVDEDIVLPGTTDPLLFQFACRLGEHIRDMPEELTALVGTYLFQGRTEKAKDAVANISGFASKIGRSVGRLKADVVREICITGERGSVSFSKYAGCLELRNAAVLFLNIDGESFNNEFTDGGKMLTWFASPSNTPATPIVRRLAEDTSMVVMVVARFLKDDFVYLGRAKVASTDLCVSPIKFSLFLMDIGRVLETEQGRAIVNHGTRGGLNG